MATNDVNDSTTPDYYLGLPHETRAALADEMFSEIHEHNEGLESILWAITDRAEGLKDHDPTLRHLTKVALSWATNTGHIRQVYRLTACLAAMKRDPLTAEA